MTASGMSDHGTKRVGGYQEWMENAPPIDVRQYFRQGYEFKEATAGVCKGYLQANLTMLHKSIASNFAEFCCANSGPLPIVFQSNVGQFSAPKIAQDSDIRSDLPRYKVYTNGIETKEVKDLLDFGKKVNNFVSFYVGCSYSFDLALIQSHIPLRCLEQGCDVSTFKTNIKCHAVGEFDCYQVVSMRPIPRQLVEKAFGVTHPMSDVHGAPIHIGNPGAIGISDVLKPDYGDPNQFHSDDIAVFWSCGVTGLEAVLSAKPPLAFTHCPGGMYISDMPMDLSKYPINITDPTDLPKVISLMEEPFQASVASEATVNKIKQLEQLVFDDPGKRHLEDLLVPDDLLKSALAMSHSSSVLITTGFPCVLGGTNPYENDGLSGAITIATILQALKIKVTLVVEKGLYNLMKQVAQSLLAGGLTKEELPVLQYPQPNTSACMESARDFLTHDDGITPKYDHLVAIERTGQGSDGKHHTMHDRDVSHLVDSSDYLFEVASELPLVFTTGIGDGGNEVGMGKVFDKIVKTVPKGASIACKTSTDYLITAGLCDWGGFALSMALYLLRVCPIHDRYQRRAVGFPPTKEDKAEFREAVISVDKARELLECLQKHGFRDGISGCSALTVDTLPFEGIVDDKIKQMLDILPKA
ncbi:D-glutamate cyclase, mitochondrial-like isoform X2 [Amphiura filiformis]|uniref:D-glutamate cyclase, mitochondrial-like isoform X2 n=1 Tax=Amphiura filiformis TaxID=82378 RepID=UPI003B21C5B1